MKSKDIEIGVEYAIGSPRARYSRDNPIRGTAVAKGVRGRNSDWHRREPLLNLIEFVTEETLRHDSYTVDLADDGELAPRHVSVDRPCTQGRTALRAQPSNVLKTWAQHEADEAEKVALNAKWDREEEAHQARRAGLINDLKWAGMDGHVSERGTDIRLDVGQVEQIVALIKGAEKA